MLQIFVILSPGVEKKIRENGLSSFEQSVASAAEKIFGIKGEDNVAIMRVEAARALNEADIQIEVRYAAGKNGCGCGESFDPSREKRERLADLIVSLARISLPEGVKVSVWIKPLPPRLCIQGYAGIIWYLRRLA